MISISGSASRSFIFPAGCSASFAYLTDLNTVLQFLPHITIEQEYTHSQYCLRYSSLELGIYEVTIYCDIEASIDSHAHTLSLQPIQPRRKSVPSHAGLYSLTGHGEYRSQSVFHTWGEYTQIEYRLQLQAGLPVPLALSLVPARFLNGIANNIVARRTSEVVEGFIQHLIQAYQNSPH